MFKSIGKLVYSPTSHVGNNKNWLVLMCDDEISKYYRHLYSKNFPNLNNKYNGKMIRAIWGSHISTIRSEKIPNYHLWGLDKNKLIEFEYEPGVKDNGTYFWMRAYCPYLENLRASYGLKPQPKYNLHLTIGRVG